MIIELISTETFMSQKQFLFVIELVLLKLYKIHTSNSYNCFTATDSATSHASPEYVAAKWQGFKYLAEGP